MIDPFYIYVLLGVYLLYRYFARNVNFWKERGVIGPKPLPLFGNLLDVFTTPITELELERAKKYGKIYGYLDMMQPVISVADIELLKTMTIRDSHIFTNHLCLTPGEPLLSVMMVNLQDDEWKRVRNICTPAFTSFKIKQMFKTVTQCVDNTLTYFDGVAAKSIELDLKKTFVAYSMDVTGACIFGIETNSYKNPDSDFVRYACDISDFASPRALLGLLMPGFLRQALGFQIYEPKATAFFADMLKHVIAERRESQTAHKDLVKLMLDSEVSDAKDLQAFIDDGFTNSEVLEVKNVQQSKKKLTDHELLAQCLLMVIAGTETASSTLAFLTWILAMRPDISDKLYQEVKMYFEHGKQSFDSLLELPYLDAVMNETLRRYAPVCHFDRVCKEDYTLNGTGITIPKGTILNVPFHVIHHDPENWPQPFEFMPERFLPENKANIKPYTFIPFGIGPRICIGMKLGVLMVKAIVAKMVYNFEVVKTNNTVTEPVYCAKKVVTHCKPLFVTLRKRA